MTPIAFLALAACTTPEPPAPPVEEAPPHVVLVTLDTTRADRLGAYGYEAAHTPTFDALAARGARFDAAYSPLPLTIPAHASIFTGRRPASHGIRDNGGATLPESELTLAEIMKARGYATGASVAAFVTHQRWGFGQGFDAYFDDVHDHGGNAWHSERPGSEVVDDALAWATSQPGDAPLFLWVHLYDPHLPYAPPPEYVERSEGRPYDGELAYVDDQLARLVAALDGEDVLWVVAGDHGEGLGEHGELTHGLYAYQTAMRVPLVIAGPGVEAGVVDQPVSLVDLLPTVLDHLEIEVPEGLDGRVVPAEAPRPIPLESYQLFSRFGISPHLAVVDGPLKLIDLPRPELYDVLADPAEESNLAASRPEDVTRLRETLRSMELPPPGEGATRDPAMAMQLEALGYLEGQFEGELSEDLPDPKDHKRLVLLSQRADRRLQERRVDEAVEVLATLVGEYPHLVEFQNRYATALARAGRLDEALAVVERGLEREPDAVGLRYTKASFLFAKGKYREASALYQAVAPEMAWSPRVRTEAVTSLMRVEGSYAEGLALGERYLAEHPDDHVLAGRMGVELSHRPAEVARAIDLLKRGLEADRPDFNVAFTLGTLARMGGDWSESRRYLELELEHYPRNQPAAEALLEVMTRFKDWQAQVELTERLVGYDDKDPEIWHVRAQALFNLERHSEAREALDKGLAVAPDSPRLMLLDANLMVVEGVDREVAKARADAAMAAREAEQAAGGQVQLDRPR